MHEEECYFHPSDIRLILEGRLSGHDTITCRNRSHLFTKATMNSNGSVDKVKIEDILTLQVAIINEELAWLGQKNEKVEIVYVPEWPAGHQEITVRLTDLMSSLARDGIREIEELFTDGGVKVIAVKLLPVS